MSLDAYVDSVSAMWDAMRGLAPGEFGRFTTLVAREISVCIDEVGISTSTDRETLELVLPMPFAIAMAVAPAPNAGAIAMPPDPFAAFLRDAAAACRRIAASEDPGFSLPLALGTQAATAVQEGVNERAYITWAIYRAYLEVLLETDPLPPETERNALALFQSGLRVASSEPTSREVPEEPLRSSVGEARNRPDLGPLAWERADGKVVNPRPYTAVQAEHVRAERRRLGLE